MKHRSTRDNEGKGQKLPARPLALLEYIAQTQRSFQRDIDNAQTTEERKEWQVTRNITLWEVDSAQKYRLTSSALAMIARLRPEQGQNALKSLPGTGIWMMLDDEQCSNVYFSSIAHAATSYLEAHPYIKKMPEMLDIIVARPHLWDFQVMAMGEHPLFYLYDAETGKWTMNKADLCPTRLCEKLGTDSRGWPGWYICDVCKPKLDYWTSWFPIALMAINFDFAETIDQPEPKRFTQREMRQQRTNQGYKEVPISHTFHIITFDIAVKSPPLPKEIEHGEPSHPTWLERAIADETVLYVDKHIEESSRTLRHERYVNMRGKTITVVAHDKRIPISVKRLKQTIYRAIATERHK
jgi:hypothetical protein